MNIAIPAFYVRLDTCIYGYVTLVLCSGMCVVSLWLVSSNNFFTSLLGLISDHWISVLYIIQPGWCMEKFTPPASKRFFAVRGIISQVRKNPGYCHS